MDRGPNARLLLGALAGIAAFVLVPWALRLPLHFAAGWVAATAVFLGLTAVAIADASPDSMRRRSRQLDPRRWVILAIIVTAATASLLSFGFTLHRKGSESILMGLTVVASWLVTHTTFALHYAHHYYGDGAAFGKDDRGGLAFPGNDAPDYWDFLYFAFVVGMTCQVSDVQVTSRPMRRMTLLHGLLSFFFNTVILALAVSLIASAL